MWVNRQGIRMRASHPPIHHTHTTKNKNTNDFLTLRVRGGLPNSTRGSRASSPLCPTMAHSIPVLPSEEEEEVEAESSNASMIIVAISSSRSSRPSSPV